MSIKAVVLGFDNRGRQSYYSLGFYESPGDLLVHALCQQNNPRTVRAVIVANGIETHVEWSKRARFVPPEGWLHRIEPVCS